MQHLTWNAGLNQAVGQFTLDGLGNVALIGALHLIGYFLNLDSLPVDRL